MKKYILIGLAIFLISISLTACSSNPQNSTFGISPKSINSEDVTTSDDLTVGDDAVITGDVTISGETQAQRVVQGGTVTNATSTMWIAFALTAAQVCDSSVIEVNNSATAATHLVAASLDITLPATSTLFADCLNTDGDSVSFWFMNNSPTAASSTEIIAGTGCDARISGDTGASDTINGGYGAKITLIRDTDVLGDGGSADCLAIIEPNKAD